MRKHASTTTRILCIQENKYYAFNGNKNITGSYEQDLLLLCICNFLFPITPMIIAIQCMKERYMKWVKIVWHAIFLRSTVQQWCHFKISLGFMFPFVWNSTKKFKNDIGCRRHMKSQIIALMHNFQWFTIEMVKLILNMTAAAKSLW